MSDSDHEQEEEQEQDVKPAAKRQSLGGGRAAKKKPNYLESDEEQENEAEDMKPVAARNGKAKLNPAKKEPSVSLIFLAVKELTGTANGRR